MMDRPYTPISCEAHDRLLALATLRQECEITVSPAGAPADSVRGIVEDVYSRGGAEYLRLRDGRTFRLDEILELDGQPIPPA